MDVVLDAMKKSSVGGAALEQAADRIARPSQDTLADLKLDQALGFLRDGRIPHCCNLDEDTDIVLNFFFIRDGALLSITQESCDVVAEAYTLWSGARAEASAPRVVEWSRVVRDKLEIVDPSLTASLWASLVDGGVGSVNGGDLTEIDAAGTGMRYGCTSR